MIHKGFVIVFDVAKMETKAENCLMISSDRGVQMMLSFELFSKHLEQTQKQFSIDLFRAKNNLFSFGKRLLTNHYNKIDIFYMSRKGLLKTGNTGRLVWVNKRTGKESKGIDYQAKDGGVIFTQESGDDTAFGCLVKTTSTACNYGGTRVWFSCPKCDKRTATLYVNQDIACRACFELIYPCQEQPKKIRKASKQREGMNRIRKKLKWPLFRGFEYESSIERTRPKGMHNTTFVKLLKEHDDFMMRFIYEHRLCLA